MTYTVTVPSTLKDIYGQALGETRQRSFSVGPASKRLEGPRAELVTLDPSGPKHLSVYSTNEQKLHVRG